MDIFDGAALIGLVMLLAGLWWIWPPAALVVTGVGLVVWGVVGSGRAARRDLAEGREPAPVDR